MRAASSCSAALALWLREALTLGDAQTVVSVRVKEGETSCAAGRTGFAWPWPWPCQPVHAPQPES